MVRQADSLTITEEELLAIDPTLSATTGSRVTLNQAIRTAAQEVRVHCRMNQIDPENFHSPEALKLAVAYRASWHVLRHQAGEDNQAKATFSREESQRYLETVLVGRPPEKSVKVNPSSDSAPAGTSKPYHHWQVIS